MNASNYEEAACLNAPVGLFYDVKLYADVARVFCENCPVKEQCLQDCLEAEQYPVDGKSSVPVSSVDFHPAPGTFMLAQHMMC